MGPDKCPEYSTNKVPLSRTEQGHLANDVFELEGRILIADFGVDWRHIKQTTLKDKLLISWLKRFEEDESFLIEIYGYTDCTGSESNKLFLRKGRASQVYRLFRSPARSRIRFVGPAPKDTYVSDNDSVVGRARNRSVTIKFERSFNFPPEIIEPKTCKEVAKEEKSFEEYVTLIRCIEKAFPQFTPRKLLSLLRQRYQGAKNWSCTKIAQWPQVIPCGMKLKDPRNKKVRPLFEALCSNKIQKVQIVNGIDMGHVFTGLEAMTCPNGSLNFKAKGFSVVLNVANEEFATWVGDLVSAVGLRVADQELRGVKKPWDAYFLKPGTKAPESDLLGDIDSYSIRHGLLNVPCEDSRLKPIKPFNKKVSDIFAEYYLSADGPLKDKIRQRFRVS